MVFKQVMNLATLVALNSLEKRDSAITKVISQINIKYPTQPNDLTDLYSCQLNSGTNETCSCTLPIPGAML